MTVKYACYRDARRQPRRGRHPRADGARAAAPARGRRAAVLLLALGLFGAALLYGDGMITPAISVLSAVEGLSMATPAFEPYVVPDHGRDPDRRSSWCSAAARPSRRDLRPGDDRLVRGACRCWACGGSRVEPHVLSAVSPLHAMRFLCEPTAITASSSSARCSSPSPAARRSTPTWDTSAPADSAGLVRLVFPALLLNYFGQGALLLQHPDAAETCSYRLAPAWRRLPAGRARDGAASSPARR